MANMAKPLKRLSSTRGEGTWGYAFIAVALVAFAMFTAYPVVSAFFISLLEYKAIDGFSSPFVGLDNYINSLQDPLFWKALKNTVVYTLLTVPVNLLISLGVAILVLPLNKKTQTFFKAAYYLPVVASGVALSVVWLWIFDPLPGGILNQMLAFFGAENKNWLGTTATSMFSLVLMSWLSSHGKMIIIYVAGLFGIDDSYYEAAELDGANFFQKLRYIVLPALKPATLFLLVTAVIDSFQVFQNAFLMTSGGPDNATTMVGLLIFNNAFTYFEFGKAAAQSLILAAIIAFISVVQFKYAGKDVEY